MSAATLSRSNCCTHDKNTTRSTTSTPSTTTRSLRHQPSKLDLIDDTTLTSLPFPPPPPFKRTSNQSSRNSSVFSKPKLQQQQQQQQCQQHQVLMSLSKSRSPSSSCQESIDSQLRPTSSASSSDACQFGDDEAEAIAEAKYNTEDVRDCDRDDDDNDDDDDDDEDYEYSYDDDGDDADDPIVLVEDYISPRTCPAASVEEPMKASNSNLTEYHLSRQKSLSNFKQRLMSSTTTTNSQATLADGISNKKSENACSSDHHTRSDEDFQAIFGDIPYCKLLKYCDLCDRPLYEISSIINSRKSANLQEFVCGDCISLYEVYLVEEQNQGMTKKKKKKSCVGRMDNKTAVKLLRILNKYV
ncbi:uncharacterized protein LODBEIA_P43980 [Lodderomyces beijingensis]|uniref:Uncharacterized protein n=1 Tax=Lodderomyces beijingensis TaxID=1775926 RepID=A0ABP0ZQH3_9ASCO